MVHTCELENNDWNAELDTFLMPYRSTIRGTTARTPHELLFGRPMRYLIPQYTAPTAETGISKHLKSTELRRKPYNKHHADIRRSDLPHDFCIGQQVLCKQFQLNKFTPFCDPIPYTIISIHGSQVRASKCSRVITPNASFFKETSEIIRVLPRAEPELDYTVPPSPDVDGQTLLPGASVQLSPPHQRHPASERKLPRHLADFTA